MKEIQPTSFEKMLEEGKKKQAEFAKLPKEEQERAIRERNEILAKLGGGGPLAIYIKE